VEVVVGMAVGLLVVVAVELWLEVFLMPMLYLLH
jgi:hypothetical protein